MVDIVEDEANGAEVAWTGPDTGFVAGLPGGHEIDIDEPAPVGQNQGPRPTDLLLASAASCSGISAVSLFKKMRQPVIGLNIRASGGQTVGVAQGLHGYTARFRRSGRPRRK